MSLANHRHPPKRSLPGCARAMIVFSVIILAPTLAFVLGVVYLAVRADNQKAVEVELKALRAEGYPTTLQELDAWYPTVSDDKNAALFLKQAAQSFVDVQPSSIMVPLLGKRPLPPPGEVWPEHMITATQMWLLTNEEYATHINRLLHYRDAHFVSLLQGPETPLPHLEQLRTASYTMGLQAILFAHEDDMDGAMQSLRVAWHLPTLLRNEPVVESHSVRIALRKLAATYTATVLSLSEPTDEHLVELIEVVQQEHDSEALARVMIGDLNLACAAIEEVREAEKSPMRRGTLRVLEVFGAGPYHDQLQLIQVFRKIVAAADESPIEHRRLEDELLEEWAELNSRPAWKVAGHGVTEFTLKRHKETALWHDYGLEILHVTCAGLLVERYRLRHGSLPKSLEELTPDFSKTVPIDSFDEEPLRYETQSGGFTIYSIGLDFRDDEGVPVGELAKAHHRGDITFSVVRQRNENSQEVADDVQ